MARMIPPFPALETPPSERYVYERFQSVLPDTWTVIHSQRFLLPEKRGAWEGELDFLILDPSRGAIGLEVKGGGVERTAAGWSSVDRRGTRHDIKDPGRQASSAVHAIRKYLETTPGFGGKGFRCRFGWGVVLPNVESPADMGPDLPRDVVLDRSDFAHLRPSSVDRVFARHCGDGQPLSEAGADAFVATLVERYPPAGRLFLQFKEENQRLEELTEQQMDILDSLAAHRRAAIKGAAGTGKTVLAMEKARRLATTGQRVLLLCFNRPLAQDLAARADGFGFDVETFHQFCRRLASQAGVRFEPRMKGDRDTRFWGEEAPARLLEALRQLPEDVRYDAIVVDEGQDFLPNWWSCLDEALRRRREGTLYAFYDSNQSIYGRDGGGPPGALEVMETRLVKNCRNTVRIAEYTARLVGTEPHVRAGAPQGQHVEEVICASSEEVVRRVAARLDQLVLREKVDPAAIAIVSTRTLKNSPFARDHRAGRFELVNLDERGRPPSSASHRVVFDTLHRFKGLERDVVILLDLPGGDLDVTARGAAGRAAGTDDDGPGLHARRRYVAASRARNLLVVVRLNAK